GSEVSGVASVTVRLPLVINELLADVPPDDPATLEIEGDANRDGVRGADDDEFVELFNYSAEPVELSGVQVADATTVRFTFPAHTTLEAGRAVLVFGGGSPPAGAFAGALVLKASSLSLNDTGDTVTVKLPLAARTVVIDSTAYGAGTSISAPRDQSLTRSPDAGAGFTGGGFVAHKTAAGAGGRAYSPGTRADGTSFNSPPAPLPSPTPTPTPTVTPTPTATPSSSPSPTSTPTPAPTSTPTPTATPTPSSTPTPTITPTPSPTSTPTPTPSPTASPSPTPQASVVISQVYGGGGNSGAPYRSDFIELFNRGDATVNLNGWSVQYASATGTGNFGSNVTQLSGSIAPGRYFLIQEAGGSTGSALPTPDVAGGNVNMATSGGKVILVNAPAGLACNGGSTPCAAGDSAKIVDLVGYGNANFFEGAGAAPATSNTTAVLRKGEGCVESDDNKSDFATGPPNPRNGVSAPHACTVARALTEDSSPDAKTGESSDSERALPSFYLFLYGLTFSEPRPSEGSTRWRRGAWAYARRGRPSARPPPRGAWP
ncbi:MAG TPA: lamin tail domain-containing protein, partial [Pyrinomonadaceae bacterium]|nr:lamin tail domain-containing protein [Pyrinomonadaceae bacterium]